MKKRLLLALALVLVLVAMPVSAWGTGGTGGTCEYSKKVKLIAGQDTPVGKVKVWSEGDDLYVRYRVTKDKCFLTETHLAVADSLGGIPQTKKGNPIPGQFEYTMEHNPPVEEKTYIIDLAAWPEGTKLFIAAHAVVTCDCFGEDTAWGAGKDFPGKNWATYLKVIPDCG